eukprot:GHVT01081046.1.p3 GENE.GHVT01081046.1~~GHVT01081046.1.p3  ORF type:complete len:106 (+),score=5.57 GHVT01081046.1:569-886(+)
MARSNPTNMACLHTFQVPSTLCWGRGHSAHIRQAKSAIPIRGTTFLAALHSAVVASTVMGISHSTMSVLYHIFQEEYKHQDCSDHIVEVAKLAMATKGTNHQELK